MVLLNVESAVLESPKPRRSTAKTAVPGGEERDEFVEGPPRLGEAVDEHDWGSGGAGGNVMQHGAVDAR